MIVTSSHVGPNNALLEQLRAITGSEGVVCGQELRERASSYWDPSPMAALALVRPRSTEAVSQVMQLCHQLGQPVVIHGGLTGCVDGTVVDATELVISLERMNLIEEIDSIGKTATVQAGVVLQTLQQAVAEHDLFLPLDLGARGSCTIGGNVATNAGGMNVIRYGMMREQVLGLEVVLADGTILSSMNRMLKNNAGYDLKQLFIGSEGTLGIVTRIVVKLKPLLVNHNCALVALESFDAVIGLLSILESRMAGRLSVYEVMWSEYFSAVTMPVGHRSPMDHNHPFYVLLEVSSADPESDLAPFLSALDFATEHGLINDAVVSKSQAERSALWAIREDFSAITAVQPTYLYDISLPIRHMEMYIDEVQRRLKMRWPESRCYVLGHIGDGNLHLFITPSAAADDLHSQVDQAVYEPLSAYQGSVSAEHGIGLEKKHWLNACRTETELALMRQLKRSLDPGNLLNPGKVLDP